MVKLVQFREILSGADLYVNPDLIAYVRTNFGSGDPSTAIGFMSGNERYVHGAVGETVENLRSAEQPRPSGDTPFRD